MFRIDRMFEFFNKTESRTTFPNAFRFKFFCYTTVHARAKKNFFLVHLPVQQKIFAELVKLSCIQSSLFIGMHVSTSVSAMSLVFPDYREKYLSLNTWLGFDTDTFVYHGHPSLLTQYLARYFDKILQHMPANLTSSVFDKTFLLQYNTARTLQIFNSLIHSQQLLLLFHVFFSFIHLLIIISAFTGLCWLWQL